MIKGQVRVMGALVLAATFSLLGANPAVAQLKSVQGMLSGVVRDTAGTPQLGASVQVIPESSASAAAIGYLTNTQGVFRDEKLAPGFYTVRVTLAGFLPTLEKHVRISANLTTIVRIQLESMFASLEQLRRAPSAAASEADDWKWVLRSASADTSRSSMDGRGPHQRSRRELGFCSIRAGARPPGIYGRRSQARFGFQSSREPCNRLCL